MKSAVEFQGDGLAYEGERLLAERRLPEALIRFVQAETAGCNPDRCAAGRWMVFMLRGEFEAAWQESDRIRERGRPDPDRFWNGESVVGRRVIVRCLRGFGDAVQFLRYVRGLREIASRVIVEVPPRFVALANAFDGIDEVVTWGENAPAHEPVWDVQVEVMELPYIFRTRLSDLPLATRYLKIDGHEVARVGQLLGVGVNTCVGEWNPERGFSFGMLTQIFALRGIEFWDLRPGEEIALDGGFVDRSGWRDNARCENSLAGLAETIAGLDLVITVDTLTAHLAGALGVRCWVLLQHEADWRWMHRREDSPWYPTLRLFRQPQPGDWPSVIRQVRDELAAECESMALATPLVRAL